MREVGAWPCQGPGAGAAAARAAPRRDHAAAGPVAATLRRSGAAAADADSDEAWLVESKGTADANQIAALEALRARPLVARDESFQLLVRAVRETTTVPALVDGLERARRQTVADLKQVPATPSTRRLARFVLSPSTLGVYIHYRCPRVLLRLAKRNAGLDYRVRATEASRGSTATKAFDSGAAIVPGGPTDRDVSEAAAALSMVSLVSGRGSDHEMWLNRQLETVGVACESWFRSEVAAEVPRTFYLVDVEEEACARPRDGVRFEEAYDALSLHYLREAPVGTALFQPALNVRLIGERIGPRGCVSGERRVYAALGLLDAFDRGDVSLSRALVDYVLIVPDATGRRSLVVIDAKASKRVKLEHQIQVTLYTMLIDVAFGRTDFVAAAPGACVVGGVWLPARASPQIFEVADLQKKVREMLANEVSALLTADAHARSFEDGHGRLAPTNLLRKVQLPRVVREAGSEPRSIVRAAGSPSGRRSRAESVRGRRRGVQPHRAARDGRLHCGAQHHHQSHAPGAGARDSSPIRGRRAAKPITADAPRPTREHGRAHGPAVGVAAVSSRRGGRLRQRLRRRPLSEPRADGLRSNACTAPRRAVAAVACGKLFAVLW